MYIKKCFYPTKFSYAIIIIIIINNTIFIINTKNKSKIKTVFFTVIELFNYTDINLQTS